MYLVDWSGFPIVMSMAGPTLKLSAKLFLLLTSQCWLSCFGCGFWWHGQDKVWSDLNPEFCKRAQFLLISLDSTQISSLCVSFKTKTCQNSKPANAPFVRALCPYFTLATAQSDLERSAAVNHLTTKLQRSIIAAVPVLPQFRFKFEIYGNLKC